MKLLISWLAYNNDFLKGNVNEQGPTYSYHKHYFAKENYSKHLILATYSGENRRLDLLQNRLVRDFPDHLIQPQQIKINDPIDLKEVKTKVEEILLSYSTDDIDIFFSPGTSIMQVAWYICHSSLGLKTRLIQLRPSHFSSDETPERVFIDTEASDIPRSLILKQTSEYTTENKDESSDYLITESLNSVYNNAYKIAQTDQVPALIFGETGTGKEHLANYIHKNSIRYKNPFLTINCSAFSDNLLETRLFGYKKGAFTGADTDKDGLFHNADGGTLFLDEIADISPYMQQALLRVLEEMEIMPVGGTPETIDVRIIAASNQNLTDLCKEGQFRWDLYYRLNVAPIELPSIQQRGQKEIIQLINHFIKSKQSALRKDYSLTFDKYTVETLTSYSYPGNVRELENLIERLYIFAPQTVTLNDLPTHIINDQSEKSLLLKDVEKRHIEYVIKLFDGNKSKAAKALGIALNTLKSKL